MLKKIGKSLKPLMFGHLRGNVKINVSCVHNVHTVNSEKWQAGGFDNKTETKKKKNQHTRLNNSRICDEGEGGGRKISLMGEGKTHAHFLLCGRMMAFFYIFVAAVSGSKHSFGVALEVLEFISISVCYH